MSEEKNKIYIPISIVIAGILLAGGIFFENKNNISDVKGAEETIEEQVIPKGGVILPVTWGDLGAKLSSVGVIDGVAMKTLYEGRGEYSEEYDKLLFGQNDKKLVINSQNAGFLLNLFWALGLGQKNEILESGPMSDPRYGGPQVFASTGGWVLAKDNAMAHYSKHILVPLTPEQKQLVEKISKGIFRPCCNNSTYFPDCNHGMAMLGLLELMASQNATEDEMWRAALAVNSYWFPSTYVTLGTYFAGQRVEWKKVSPQEVLSAEYSSATGWNNIQSKLIPKEIPSGGGCSV